MQALRHNGRWKDVRLKSKVRKVMDTVGRLRKNAEARPGKGTDRPQSACPHSVLLPVWDNVAYIGNSDRVAAYSCKACRVTVSRHEGQQLCASEANRMRSGMRQAPQRHQVERETRANGEATQPHLPPNQDNRVTDTNVYCGRCESVMPNLEGPLPCPAYCKGCV